MRLTVTDGNGAVSQATRTVSSNNTPPLVSVDAPAGTLTWRVGDTIHVSGSATDAQDGDLSTAIVWTVTIKHCPPGGSCHDHPLVTFSGPSGDIVAPDHDAPTWLEITASVPDGGGLTDTETIELAPETSTVTVDDVADGPAGLDGQPGRSRPRSPRLVMGSTRTVSASSPAAMGEKTYAFVSWSDGGAANHPTPRRRARPP